MKRIDVPTDFLSDRTKGDELKLPKDTAHYVHNVLRRGPDDRLELFDGTGNQAVIRILSVDDGVLVEVLEWEEADKRESPLSTVLFQAIPKGKRWKWILEKSTELGVDTVVPLESERTVKKIPEDRIDGRLQRWKRKVAAAARQCGRALTPSVVAPLTPKKAYEQHPCDVHLVAHPEKETAGVVTTLGRFDDVQKVGVWIGPEGGFSDDEVDTLASYDDVIRTRLGPRILRADTAGIAALALTQATLGDLN